MTRLGMVVNNSDVFETASSLCLCGGNSVAPVLYLLVRRRCAGGLSCVSWRICWCTHLFARGCARRCEHFYEHSRVSNVGVHIRVKNPG